MTTLRIATYNIHKCVGIDRRYSPERIADVLREIDADVIALQEVVCRSHSHRRDDQAKFIADSLGMEFRLGDNRKHDGGDYGNVTLSRFPIKRQKNYDISVSKREPRGCLWTELDVRGRTVHFANVHMGTSYFERRRQVNKILARQVLENPSLRGRRIVAGDFNEWINGLTTRLFRSRFNAVDARKHLDASGTFPSLLPLLQLDYIYYDDSFELKEAHLHRSGAAKIASDHLPVVAEFEVR